MGMPSLRTAALAFAASMTLAACTTYDDYGFGSARISVGYGDYYDPWYDPYWGDPYWGWYDGYYYPGVGVFVYDEWRRPHRWNDRHRRFWSDRRHHWRGRGDWREDRREFRENWRDFRRDRRMDDRAFRQDRRMDRRAFREGQVTREQFRAERRDDRRDYRREFRRDRRQLRRENRRDRRD